PALVGFPAFAELVDNLGVPALAHPSLAGIAAIAPELLLGKLFRLFGADAVIFPSFGGRFAYTRRQCKDLAAGGRAPWPPPRASLPVPAGGVAVERVTDLIEFYGQDAMVLVGGSLLAAGDRLAERARSFVDTVQRVGSQLSSPQPAR